MSQKPTIIYVPPFRVSENCGHMPGGHEAATVHEDPGHRFSANHRVSQ